MKHFYNQRYLVGNYLFTNIIFCILTAYPLSVIEDILDSQRGEHHTNCLSWHTHLRTV